MIIRKYDRKGTKIKDFDNIRDAADSIRVAAPALELFLSGKTKMKYLKEFFFEYITEGDTVVPLGEPTSEPVSEQPLTVPIPTEYDAPPQDPDDERWLTPFERIQRRGKLLLLLPVLLFASCSFKHQPEVRKGIYCMIIADTIAHTQSFAYARQIIKDTFTSVRVDSFTTQVKWIRDTLYEVQWLYRVKDSTGKSRDTILYPRLLKQFVYVIPYR